MNRNADEVLQAKTFFKTFGIDLDLCTEEISTLLTDYFLNGSEDAIRNLLLRLKSDQEKTSN